MQWHEQGCRIALIDGLGHGPAAAAAAQSAIDVLTARPLLSPTDAMHACHYALYGTRGAVISIAGIDLDQGQLVYAGVGNVEAQFRQSGRTQRLIAYRGIVGVALPPVRSFQIALERDWLLALHTDGVSARFALDGIPDVDSATPERLASLVLTGWGRASDDATVVVARSPEAGAHRPTE